MSQQRWAAHIQPFTWDGVTLPPLETTSLEQWKSPTSPRFRFLVEKGTVHKEQPAELARTLPPLPIPKPRGGVVTTDELFGNTCRGVERLPRKTTLITGYSREHQTLESAATNHLRLVADSFGYDPTAVRFRMVHRVLVNPHVARSNDPDVEQDVFLGHADEDDLLYSHLEIFADKTLAPVILTEHCVEVLTKNSFGLFICGDWNDDSYNYFYALPQCALRESITNLKNLLQSDSLLQLQELPCPNYVFSLLVAHIAELRMKGNNDSLKFLSADDDTDWEDIDSYHYQEAANSIVRVTQVGTSSIIPVYRVSYKFDDGLYTCTLGVRRNMRTGTLHVEQIPPRRRSRSP